MRTSAFAVLAMTWLLALTQPAAALLCGTILSPVSVSATPVNFGNYMATSPSAVTANGSISISCGLGAELLPNFVVSLSRGSAVSFSPRTMKMGAAALSYNLYTTAAFTNIWGDGTAGTVQQTFSTNIQLGDVSFTVYGRVPTGQFVTTGGPYTDSITVTVTY